MICRLGEMFCPALMISTGQGEFQEGSQFLNASVQKRKRFGLSAYQEQILALLDLSCA